MSSILGYMRLKTSISAADHEKYKAALTKAGASKVFEDIPPKSALVSPQFLAMISAAKAGDKILVYRLSHFSTMQNNLVSVLSRLFELKLHLSVIELSLDTAKPQDNDALRLIAAVNVFNSGVIIADGGDGGGNG